MFKIERGGRLADAVRVVVVLVDAAVIGIESCNSGVSAFRLLLFRRNTTSANLVLQPGAMARTAEVQTLALLVPVALSGIGEALTTVVPRPVTVRAIQIASLRIHRLLR